MSLIKLKIATRVLAASVAFTISGWVIQTALAHKPPEPGNRKQKKPAAAAVLAANSAHASKDDLNAESFAKLLATIRPQAGEWRHLRVHWYTDIVAARKKAAAEDKPILLFRTEGAGYNDPLGQC